MIDSTSMRRKHAWNGYDIKQVCRYHRLSDGSVPSYSAPFVTEHTILRPPSTPASGNGNACDAAQTNLAQQRKLAISLRRKIMNKKQIIGMARSFVGELEEMTGQLIGNQNLRRRGIAEKLLGKTETLAGNAMETIKAAIRRH